MDCPSCEAKTKVLESRSAPGGAMRRRRECTGCGERFTTFERREREPAWVRKRGGERQPFDVSKLRAGLGRAAHKRPVAPAALDAIAERVALAAERAPGSELGSERVRDMCLEGLSELDAGAYLQFAGVELGDFDSVRAAMDRHELRGSRKDRDRPAKTAAGSVRDGEDAPELPPETGSEPTRGEI
jgi:transcriptional repressor NrdR